jgi:hypothetical protein
MLNAVTLESFRASIIHVDRQCDRYRTLGKHKPFPIIRVDAQVIGNDLKLITGHAKNVVLVDMHAAKANLTDSQKERDLFAHESAGVKSKSLLEDRQPCL